MAKIASSAVVSKLVEIVGDVTIGENTVVHPSCKILAEGGPIVIGVNCLIEELSVIRNGSAEPMEVGANNVFEVGAVCEARRVGQGNVFSARCAVGSGVTVGDRCVVGVAVQLQQEEELANGTIVWKDSQSVTTGRRVVPDRDGPGEFYTKQREQLQKIIPKFNELQT